MRIFRAIVITLGMVGILVLLGLLFGYYLYALTPEIQTRLVPVLPDEKAALSFEEKIASFKAEIEEAADTGQKKEVNLQLTEKEINAKISKELAKAKSEGKPLVEKMIVNLRGNNDGQFLVYAQLEVPGINAKTGMVGQIKVVDGKPRIALSDFDLGKLPLPSFFHKRVEQLLNIFIDIELANLPLKITNVEIENRQLFITGLAGVTK